MRSGALVHRGGVRREQQRAVWALSLSGDYDGGGQQHGDRVNQNPCLAEHHPRRARQYTRPSVFLTAMAQEICKSTPGVILQFVPMARREMAASCKELQNDARHRFADFARFLFGAMVLAGLGGVGRGRADRRSEHRERVRA